MRLSIGIVGLALLAGCVPVRVNEVKGPDGKAALALNCGNATDCYQKAGELCPAGYDFVDRNYASNVWVSDGYFWGGSVTTLVVECKAPATTKN